MRASVYFISGPDRSTVKIGKAINVAKRVGDIRNMNAAPLDILAVVDGYSIVENFFHRRFADLRIHGEWFRLESPILDLIAEIAEHGPGITAKLCPAPLSMDRGALRRRARDAAVAAPPVVPIEAPLPRVVGPISDAAILEAWAAAGGLAFARPRAIQDLGARFDYWNRRSDSFIRGAWAEDGKWADYGSNAGTRFAQHLAEASEGARVRLFVAYAIAMSTRRDDSDSWLYEFSSAAETTLLSGVSDSERFWPGNGKLLIPIDRIGVHHPCICGIRQIEFDRDPRKMVAVLARATRCGMGRVELVTLPGDAARRRP